MAAAGGAGGEAWRVAFLGAGNMATAMIKGLVSSGTLPAASVSVSSPSGPSAELVALGVRCVRANAECVVGADAVVLAVKPFNVEPALLECMAVIPPGALIVSLAAGVTCDTIQTVFSLARPIGLSRRIVRVMPNTPCAIGAGASGMARGPGATDADMAFVGRLMRAVGVVHEVKEAQLDAVTGLSGSGPAYVFMMIEALADGGVAAGLPRAVAMSLATSVVRGGATLVATSGDHPAVLKDAVASPGGTTIAGIAALEAGSFRGTVISAVVAASRRATELRGGRA